MHIRVAGAFAVIGFIISLFSGIMVGNRITHILTVTLISTVLFGALGYGLYAFLQKQVPQFIDFLQELEMNSGIYDYETGSEKETIDSFSNTVSTGSKSGSSYSSSSGGSDGYDMPRTPPKNGKFGDHIIVDNIEIKNEPKLMAEAIRTMIARDEMEGISTTTVQQPTVPKK